VWIGWSFGARGYNCSDSPPVWPYRMPG